MRQVVTLSGDGHMLLLHGLQQGGLRARTSAVDLVGHEKLREYGPAQKAEETPARIALFKNFRADDVRGHQIGRELNPFPVEAENDSERFHKSGFCEARYADE